jgi:ubiquinone/menaquinone biosynthesis C-methylase UbiE
MTDAFEASAERNSYVIDSEHTAEMARLLDQDRMITATMGWWFPDHIEPEQLTTVLDVACGPGGWVQEVAFHYPHLEVTGIDISERMTAYARMQAQVQHLDNAHFQVADIKQPLPFADETFDYINARFLVGLMYPSDWVPLLKECWRVTRPGGHICLTECDRVGVTNSPAFEYTQQRIEQALARTGRALVPGIEEARITPMLGAFLREAGWRQMGLQAHVLDYSADTDLHVSNCRNIIAGFTLVQPFLIKTGVTTASEWEHLLTQMQVEMMAPTFRGLWYYLSVFGHKALA